VRRTRRGGWYSIRVESAGLRSGNYARFSVGGRRVNFRTTRGLNIVAWHPLTFKRLLARGYDTFADRGAADRIGRDFRRLPRGSIVAVACKDSCAKHLNKGLKNAMAWHGSKYIKMLKYRESFAFIGRKGFRKSVEQRGDQKHRSVVSWRYKVTGGRRAIRRATRRRGLPRVRVPRRARRIVRRRMRRRAGRRGRRVIRRRGRRVIRRRGRRVVRRRGRRGGVCRGACLRKIRNLQRQLRNSKLRWSKRVNHLKRRVNVRYQRRKRIIKKLFKTKKITRKVYKKRLIRL